MQTEVISDDEQTEIFDFYSTVSYNFGVHVLDCGNNHNSSRGFRVSHRSRSNSNKPLKIRKIPKK